MNSIISNHSKKQTGLNLQDVQENTISPDILDINNCEVFESCGKGSFGLVIKVKNPISCQFFAAKLMYYLKIEENYIKKEIQLLEKISKISQKPKSLSKFYGYTKTKREFMLLFKFYP